MKEIKRIFGNKYLKSPILKYIKKSIFCFCSVALILCIIFTDDETQLGYYIIPAIPAGIMTTVAIVIIFFLAEYFYLMHLVKMAFQDMDHKKQLFFVEKIEPIQNLHKGNYYLFDEIFIYETSIGLVPIHYKNVKKVIVKKDAQNTKTIIYKLKKGFTFHFDIFSREDFIDQLVAIKSWDEDIPILFASMPDLSKL